MQQTPQHQPQNRMGMQKIPALLVSMLDESSVVSKSDVISSTQTALHIATLGYLFMGVSVAIPGRAARLRRNLHAVDYFRFEAYFSHAAARVSVYAMQKRRRNDMVGVPDFRSRRRRRIVRISAAPHTQTNKNAANVPERCAKSCARFIIFPPLQVFQVVRQSFPDGFYPFQKAFYIFPAPVSPRLRAFFFFAPYAFFSLSEASSRSLPFKR